MKIVRITGKRGISLFFIGILAYFLIGTLFSCSTTKHLPEGEVLYTGNKNIFKDASTTPVGETAISEVTAALVKVRQRSYLVFCLSPSACGCIMTL